MHFMLQKKKQISFTNKFKLNFCINSLPAVEIPIFTPFQQIAILKHLLLQNKFDKIILWTVLKLQLNYTLVNKNTLVSFLDTSAWLI